MSHNTGSSASKRIAITGATAGIGLETAKALAGQGHHLLVHGRSAHKVDAIGRELSALAGGGQVEGFVADLSRLSEVERLAAELSQSPGGLDVLINNAGVFQTREPSTPEGLDVRFVVNTLAPFLLTRRLLPALGARGRVVNLSSAAQSPVSLAALAGRERLEAFEAYAQSKLALTMWSRHLGTALGERGPVIVSVNPGSMLGTAMVRQGFGVAGKSVNIGVKILVRAALSDEFASAQGAYFDNDAGRFAEPHSDALDASKCEALVARLEEMAP